MDDAERFVSSFFLIVRFLSGKIVRTLFGQFYRPIASDDKDLQISHDKTDFSSADKIGRLYST